MEKNISVLDKVHLQKYIYLILLFVDEQIKPALFETLFLQLRREDNYWKTGCFEKEINQILNTLFLDIDAYTPSDLYDKDSQFDIDEMELRIRAQTALNELKELL